MEPLCLCTVSSHDFALSLDLELTLVARPPKDESIGMVLPGLSPTKTKPICELILQDSVFITQQS